MTKCVDFSQPVVIIIDDDENLRESLRWLFESVNLQVVTFASAMEFLAAPPAAGSGCILLDVRMPGMSGLELQTKLPGLLPGVPSIVMSAHADVRMAVRALKSGAFDFVEKPVNQQDLLETVWRAIDRSETARRRNHQALEVKKLLDTLSKREREVLAMAVKGAANKNIAMRLGISGKTVEYHRANATRKLGAPSLRELILMFAADSPADNKSGN